VLPDFQGVGIGNRLSEYIGSLFVATGKTYRDRTGHPGHVLHRMKSPLWRSTTKMGFVRKPGSKSLTQFVATASTSRLTMSFQYVGPANEIDARKFGLLKNRKAVTC